MVLLVFVPLSVAGSFLGLPPNLLFFLSALAIVPLAKFIGESTEELSARSGPALGGLLNATFGNATELLIGLFAIRQGLIEVVKASLTGSIVGNLLLVLGTAIFAGGTRYKIQQFNRTAALANASTLLLAVIAMTIPAIFFQTAPAVNRNVTTESLSVLVSVLMIATYLASVWFALHTHPYLYNDEMQQYEAKWTVKRSATTLALATFAAAWMSEILVHSIEPVALQFGWTQMFIGVVVVAIVGNAAEHTSAILMAAK
ncbi:MAG TPA: calcium/proton exchanger, partial [Candidatus Binataceae bacterium]|nr:calcium/proton exchanger [Candidatus Binataceae bacterium]